MKNKYLVAHILELFGTFAVGFWAIYLIITNIFFIFKRPVANINMAISLVATVIFIIWYARRKFSNYIFLLTAALILLITTFSACLFVSGKVYDTSYDGQAYHQEAVFLLKNGWNPVYTVLETQATANLETWLNHYPKGVWLIASGIYELTGNIEYGKVFSIYAGLIALSFCLVSIYKVQINWAIKILGILVLVFNPILVYQSLSYYLDGIVVSLLLTLCAISFKIYRDKDKSLFIPFFFTSVILMNTKLSAPVFAIIMIGVVIILCWLSNRFNLALRFTKFTTLAILTGVFFVGFNPYVINFAKNGNPLYPALGRGAIDYVPTNTPENYWGMRPPFRLMSSIFAPSTLLKGKGQTVPLKVPFTFSASELETFRETNAKTGGFGPLFSGMFILSFILFSFYLLSRNVSKRQKGSALLITLSLLGLGAVVPTSSVARYVPFVWWIPILLALIYASSHYKFANVGTYIILLLAGINIALVALSYYPYNIAQSNKLEGQLEALASAQSDKPIMINTEQFGSTKIKLSAHNIYYTEVYEAKDCFQSKKFLVRSTTNLCQN